MNATTPSITNLDDEKIITQIHSTRQRMLLISPGVSEAVARAIRDAWQRLGADHVSIILDVDPDVCRLGYGTIEGLNILIQAAAEARTLVCHQPGVRIGLLICDDLTFIFSPTPLLIESGSTQPQRPNAIQLSSPPAEVARDVGLGGNGHRDRIVGLDAVQPEQIADVQRDLARAPPVKFDLARRVRVFTSHFQFVELEMTGCFVSRKKVPIPSNLVGLAKNSAVGSQFHAHFNLVNKARLEVLIGKRVITEETLAKEKQQIIKDFLITLKSYGSVVLRANKDKLLHAVEKLKAEVAEFQKGVKLELQKHMDYNAAALVEALLPTVRTNPPESYKKYHGPNLTPEQTRHLLERDIKDAFGNAGHLVADMKLTLVFKDVAYESLVDQKFLSTAREAMRDVEFLHEEHEVVEVTSSLGKEPR